MDQTRFRLGSLVDWLVVAAFLTATAGVSILIVQELTRLSRGSARPVQVGTPSPHPAVQPAASIPSLAISVPVLKLSDGVTVERGDTFEHVAATLGREAETGAQKVEPTRLGDRVIRHYERANTRFILVFEPLQQNGPLRVSAIYVQ